MTVISSIDMAAVDRVLHSPGRLHAAGHVLQAPVPDEVNALTRQLADSIGVPYAAVTILDTKSQHVIAATDGPEVGDLHTSHCQYVVGTGSPIAIQNTQASTVWRRLARNLIRGRPLQAYLGVPLRCDGQAIGAVCVIDVEPRVWRAEDHLAVTRTSVQVARLLSV